MFFFIFPSFLLETLLLYIASKDLSQTSYFMSTNSLHLTTMCLQYKPTVVACVCIHLACKWSNWEVRNCRYSYSFGMCLKISRWCMHMLDCFLLDENMIYNISKCDSWLYRPFPFPAIVKIPRSSEGKDWFYYIDPTVTLEMLERLTAEFLAILDKCPSRLKRKMTSEVVTTNQTEITKIGDIEYHSRININKVRLLFDFWLIFLSN